MWGHQIKGINGQEMYYKALSQDHSPLRITSPDFCPAQPRAPFLEVSCWLIIRSNREREFPERMQTTLCLLAAVPLLIVGNLAFDPMLALHHHTQLRQFSEASSSHVEGSSQVSILPTTVASLSLSLSLLCFHSLGRLHALCLHGICSVEL